LTITQNGEYLPSDGVAGFSKVTAEFDTSSLPKVKVSSFKVTNDCIGEDGIWEGESLIDTSVCENLRDVFSYNTLIKKINADDWNTSNIKSISSAFAFCSNLKEIHCKNWDVSNVTNFSGAFRNTTVEILDISKWDVVAGKNFDNMFIYTNVPIMDFRNWNMSNATSVNSMFNLMYFTRSFVGGLTINEVITDDLSCLKGLSLSLNISQPPLDRASLRAVINGLADLTGQTAKTLTLGATLIAKLTEEDIAIATNKNWTIV
jgi:surface protein